MIRKLITFILIAIPILSIKAQKDKYEPGYIITLGQDTIYGELDFDTDANNASKCSFRKSLSDKKEIYKPGEISAYRFLKNGRFYISREVTIKDTKEVIFAEYLVQGLMNVFYYYDKKDNSYYFLEKEDGTMQTISKEAAQIIDSKYVEDRKYDGQLRYLFKGHIPEKYKDKHIDFSQSAIIDMAKTYHDDLCTTGEACILYQKQDPDINALDFDFSFYVGYFASQYEYYSLAKVKDSRPAVGVRVELLFPRHSRSLGLLLDASFSKIDGSKSSEDEVRSFYIKSNIIKLDFGLKYSFPKYKLRPFVAGGPSFIFLTNSKATSTKIKNPDDNPGELYLNKNMLGYFLEGGLSYKIRGNQNIFISASYNFVPKNEVEQGGKNEMKVTQFKLGYGF